MLTDAVRSKPAGLFRGPSETLRARWYAVHCLSNREAGAASHLLQQGFEIFLPRRKKSRRHARKIDTVLSPLFPGYLFVKLDITRDRWRSGNGTFGVARLVMQCDTPAPAPVGVVEALRNACDALGVLNWQPELTLGQSVRVLNGAFADLVGELDRLDGAGRVRVLLDIMGGRVPVLLPREDVISAASCV